MIANIYKGSADQGSIFSLIRWYLISYSSLFIIGMQSSIVFIMYFMTDKSISIPFSIFTMSVLLVLFTDDIGCKTDSVGSFVKTKNSFVWLLPYSRMVNFKARVISTFILFFSVIIIVMISLSIWDVGYHHGFDSLTYEIMLIPSVLIALSTTVISVVNSPIGGREFYIKAINIISINSLNIAISYLAFSFSQYGIYIMTLWSIISIMILIYFVRKSCAQYMRMNYILSGDNAFEWFANMDLFRFFSNSKHSLLSWLIVEKRFIQSILIMIFILPAYCLILHVAYDFFIYISSIFVLGLVYFSFAVKTFGNEMRETTFSTLPYSRKEVYRAKFTSFLILFAISQLIVIIEYVLYAMISNSNFDMLIVLAFLASSFIACTICFCFLATNFLSSNEETGVLVAIFIGLQMVISLANWFIVNQSVTMEIIAILIQISFVIVHLMTSYRRYLRKDISC